jgi:hypothetical protein
MNNRGFSSSSLGNLGAGGYTTIQNGTIPGLVIGQSDASHASTNQTYVKYRPTGSTTGDIESCNVVYEVITDSSSPTGSLRVSCTDIDLKFA